MKRKIVLTSLAVCLASTASAQDQTYDFTDFNALDVSAGVEVNVVLGEEFAVSAVAVSGDIDDLTINQSGKILSISREATSGGWSLFGFGPSNDEFVVTITMPDVVTLDTASGSSTKIDGISKSLQAIDATSGSYIHVSDAALDMIRIDISSGSEVRLAGTCEELAIDSSSGAMVNAGALSCGVVDISASSGAGVTTFATESVKADASSGASIRLGGDAAEVDTETSSGASITRN